ncbi:mdtC domain protein [Escherichia coli]|nr:mdtC domain protein [Escherichia coli]
MYQSHNSLIIKLPAKYISKLLQKLRNPEKHDAIDSQMGKLALLQIVGGDKLIIPFC